MTREGAETPKPGRHEIKGRTREHPQGNILARAPAVALTLLSVAAGGVYATQHEDSGGALLNQDEPRNERVTSGQLLADAQLTSADSPAGIGQEKNTYSQKLDQAKEEMGNLIGPLEAIRIAKYEPLIRETARSAGVPGDLLLGLVITESVGDSLAISGLGAKGLTQMMDPVAEKYGLYIADDLSDERFNPERVLPPSAQELREYYDKFGDWSLAFWAWHIGTPEVYDAVKTFAHLEYGVELADVNVEPKNKTNEAYEEATLIATERMEHYKNFISRQKISFSNLYENETVREMYSGGNSDETLKYLPRIEESVEVYNSQNLVKTAQEH